MHGTMPDHIFFDNNCQLAKIVEDDPDFANFGLSVDVSISKASTNSPTLFVKKTVIQLVFRSSKGQVTRLGTSTLQLLSRRTCGWVVITPCAMRC